MRRIVAFLLLSLMTVGAFAQSISVADFKLRESDMTAASLEGRRIDQNGQPAALIRIETTETGFVFEAGALGIVDSKQETGEVWVWVPRASRKITIKHPKLGVLYDYRYPLEIEAERTYWMKLTTAKIETIVKEEVRQQYLAFQITPANATLEVDDKLWTVSADGSAMKFVNFGTYTYRVQAKGYHPDAGKVTVDDPSKTQRVIVTLRPNFGWIEVPGTGNLQGANVYIDNELVGAAPCKSEALGSGPHTVRIAKEMYEPYSETVTVSDNETTHFAPTLKADFAEITLKVDADAEIWVNDQKKGIRSWRGALGSGTYKIECKQAGHESTMTSKEITADMQGQTITLSAPRPIYGSLNVESTPFATLYIDGKSMGETPSFISEVLVGNHELRLTKSGYKDYTESFSINKGERKQIKAELEVEKQPSKPEVNQPIQTSKPEKPVAVKTPETIEGISPNASCDELNRVLSAKMAETPNDVALLERIATILDNRDCTDSKAFRMAAAKLYQLEPGPDAAYFVGVNLFKDKKYRDAATYFDQATKTNDNDRKYRAYLNLSMCYWDLGSFSRARDLARNAAQINPTAGEPYLIIAELYAQSARQFNGEVEKRAVYWAAVDKCIQAKNINPSIADRANAMVRSYSAAFPTIETIFFNDYSEGQSYTVGGWIGETTTVRARK